MPDALDADAREERDAYRAGYAATVAALASLRAYLVAPRLRDAWERGVRAALTSPVGKP